jgi:hypothetical protein
MFVRAVFHRILVQITSHGTHAPFLYKGNSAKPCLLDVRSAKLKA